MQFRKSSVQQEIELHSLALRKKARVLMLDIKDFQASTKTTRKKHATFTKVFIGHDILKFWPLHSFQKSFGRGLSI